MSTPNRRADAWESFWKDAPPEKGAVAWDAPPERTAAVHHPLFAPHFGGGRTIVDLGCGNGTQTHYLAGRYARVLGVDVSGAALLRARAARGPAAGFRVMDATDTGAVRSLSAELGECDVYMRGVLHHCDQEERSRIAASVALLVGEHGRAFDVEPAAAGGALLGALMGRPEGPPPALAAVFAHGIRPLEMPDGSVPEVFRGAGLEVLAAGTAPLALTLVDADGIPLDLPSNWLVVGRNG